MDNRRLQGIRLENGTVAGTDLPSLGDRDALADWKDALMGRRLPLLVVTPPPHRLTGVPFGHLKRLGGLAPVWADASPEDPEDVVDLAFSGPQKLLLWWSAIKDDADAWLESLDGHGLLGIDDGDDGTAALAVAETYDLDVVLRGKAVGLAKEAAAVERDVLAWRQDNDGPWGLGLEVLAARPVPEPDADAEANAGAPAVPEAPRAIL